LLHADLGSSRVKVAGALRGAAHQGMEGSSHTHVLGGEDEEGIKGQIRPDEQHTTYQLFLLCSPQELLGRVADIGV